jgi:transposase
MARYDLTDSEWSVIEPVLPRVDDRRVSNGNFWVLRSGAPWADLPERNGPLLTGQKESQLILGDKASDADWIRQQIEGQTG